MKDILGTRLKINDVVLYSYSVRGSVRHYIGEIIRFTPQRVILNINHGEIMVTSSSLLIITEHLSQVKQVPISELHRFYGHV